MKTHFLLSLLLVCAVSLSLQAQDQAPANQEKKEVPFIKKLTTENGGGKVQVYQDDRLGNLMVEKTKTNKENSNQDFILINGYRVQVYSSNSPKKSKNEAFKIESEIKTKHPEFATYVTFTSPFWKVRIGDCKNYQEAFNLSKVLKEDFPNMKTEIYIVKEDNIRLSIK
jgi:hypothetical protein